MDIEEWVREVDVESAEQLLAHLSPSSEYFRSAIPQRWIFRGECDRDVPLQPTICRPEIWQRAMQVANVGAYERHGDVSTASELFMTFTEMKLLEQFIYRTDESGLSIPDYSPYVAHWLGDYTEWLRTMLNSERFTAESSASHPLNKGYDFRDSGCWPSTFINSMLAVARHHGMAARLLDWSMSAPIAAYFAVKDIISLLDRNEKVPPTFSVWALSRSITGRLAAYPSPQPPEICYIRTPSFGNLHMVAQRGVFTSRITYPHEFWNDCECRGLADLIEERVNFIKRHDRSQVSGPFLLRFRLGSDHYGSLLWLLTKMGVSGNILFPTYSGVVESFSEELHFAE